MNKTLGILKEVEVRSLWNDEAKEFTPWLAQPEHLQELGNAIGMSLELDGKEIWIGAYKADIIARDLNTEQLVIIENQLERTNHDHLGKIITYAAGIGAKTVVWISKNITEEHRKAIDWLNDITVQDINFFAVQVQLWQIDDSKPAVKFEVICSPNEWSKSVKAVAASKEVTETKQLQYGFWSSFKDFAQQKRSFIQFHAARPQHWLTAAVGRSGFHIGLTINTRSNKLGTEVYIGHSQSKEAFRSLEKDKEKIAQETNRVLDWQFLEESKGSRIANYTEGDIREKERWPQYFEHLLATAEALHKSFSPRIKKLQLS